jgi:predicted dehydrogenase
MGRNSISRRSFLADGAALVGGATLSAASYARVPGANERVGVGFIGYGLIGKRHVIDFQAQPDVDMVAVSEVHRGRLEEARAFVTGGTASASGTGPPARDGGRSSGTAVRGYADFRKLLDDRNVDAVVVSTPDHWHALMTMLACAAGKDVYVEKPLTLFAKEGRWMIDVARRHERVVQVGTQQRSGQHYQRARELIQQGHIGQVMSVRLTAARNITPGYGDFPDGDPPPELDWDLWLGPAPARRYNPLRGIYHFRWFWDYSGGQMTNLGQHSLDIVDWVLRLDTLRSVVSVGGRYVLKDRGETPDTQDALFECDGWTAAWSMRECSGGAKTEHGLEFYGTKGSLGISRKSFRITADKDVSPEMTVPQFTGAHPVGGPNAVEAPKDLPLRTAAVEDKSGDDRAQFRDHVRNFLDCVKSRETPISDLESGHRVATICHLANISLRLGRKLNWDGEHETIVGDEDAAAWLARPYRAPWDRELRALGVG